MSCGKTELCIFDAALPQTVVESSNFEEIFPLNTITGDDCPDIEFNIIGSNTDYLDLNDSLLFVEIKVKDKDGAALVDASDVVPVNFLLHALFKDVILTMNNEVIEGGNGVYAQKAMIETLINYSSDTKNCNLSSMGYDDTEATRKGWIAKSKVFQMCGSIRLDFFNQPKYLIPGVNVHLRLKRNDNKFCLITTKDKPQLLINQVKLFIRRVKVDPSVLIGHQVGLDKKNAIYPIRKSQLLSHTIPIGSSNFYKDQIFGEERLPKFVLIAMQSATRKNGDYATDSSIFEHFNVSSIKLQRNSDYRESYSQDFENNNFMTSYVMSLIRNMGHLDKDLNCGITYVEFKENYPFFTFVLAPDFDTYTTQLPRQGNLRLEMKFAKPLASSICIHIYGLFDADIQINKNRLVTY